MKRAAPPRRLRWLVIALMIWAWVGVLPARTLDANAGDLKQITVLMHGLSGDIARTQQVIGRLQPGPITIGGRCEYDCFLGLSCKEFKWDTTWDFRPERFELLEHLREAASHSQTFDKTLAIVHIWLKYHLPAFDVLLQEQVADIKKAVKDIPANTALIAEAVKRLTTRLEQDSDTLGTTIRNLDAFIKKQHYLAARVRQTYAAHAKSWNPEMERRAAEIARMPCGGDDARRQYAGAHRNIETSLAVMNNSLAVPEQRVQAVSQALDSLIGILHNLVLNYAGLAEKLRWAEDGAAIGNAILRTRLAVVQATWNELKSYARDHLQ